MNARTAYKKFLGSPFWRSLSKKKKAGAGGRCQECGSTHLIQCHHVRYRNDWYDTKLEDLRVLCRRCHKLEHGIALSVVGQIRWHRDDLRFNRIVNWVDWLRSRADKDFPNGKLRRRDIWYLSKAVELYPRTKKDGCIPFHVKNCLNSYPNELILPDILKNC